MLIIHRYIFKELMQPLLVNLLFLTVIFLMTKMLQITKLIVNYNVSLAHIGLILAYSIPHFLVFVLPMSVMLAILLTLMRMSSENEIIALKSGGISLYRLLPPIALLAVAGFLATLFMTVYGMPRSKLAITRLTYAMLTSNTDIGIKARTFNNRFKNFTIYVNEVDLQEKSMRDVFIEDRRNPKAISTIVAPVGQFLKSKEKLTVRMRLYDGMINQVDRAKRSASTTYFKTYDVSLDMGRVAKLERYTKRDADEMSLDELRAHVREVQDDPQAHHEALIELYQKFSIPTACLALGLLAIPLGIELKSNRRSAGLGMGMFIFILYYVLMTAGRVAGEMGVLPPAIGLWLPNVIFGLGGALMLVQAAKEKPTLLVPLMRRAGGMIKRAAKIWLRHTPYRR